MQVVSARISTMMGVCIAFAVAMALMPRTTENDRFEELADDYISSLLAMNPELATQLGEHRHDHRLNDYSQAGVRRAIEMNRRYLKKIAEINAAKLNETNSVDLAILRNAIERSLYGLETLREHEWNPMVYNVGNAFYGLMTREFAPLKDRLVNLKERLRDIAGVVEAARVNLKTAPRVHVETAIQQNEGTIKLLSEELNAELALAPDLKLAVRPLQAHAVAVLKEYGEWLEKDLLPRANADFRLGDDKFRRKLAYTLDSPFTKEDVLERAQADLKATQEAIYQTALPLYRQYAKDNPERKALVQSVLSKLAEKHPDNDSIVPRAREALARVTDFVRAQGLVTLPDKPLRIIVMPEFKRGVAVAYCDSPGPLETNGETFFAISPTPADWTKQRVDSYFREYNDYMLLNLAVHEAMPGHYLQIAHNNQFEAPTRVRAVFRSGTFVEGWGSYAERMMVERGFGGPEVKMQQLKMRLRLILNAILDQKIHTAGMTEKEAMRLMTEEGYQEEGEAAGKWRRAILTSTQLSSYFVGTTELDALRAAYESRNGPIRDWKTFHDQMLSFGSPAPRYVRTLMGL